MAHRWPPLRETIGLGVGILIVVSMAIAVTKSICAADTSSRLRGQWRNLRQCRGALARNNFVAGPPLPTAATALTMLQKPKRSR